MKHGIVIGGSMAGLLCARALADHCDRVTLIERDMLPAEADHRRGVPQGRHTHGLLASGRGVLEQYFPGFAEELIGAGAVSGDIAGSSRWFLGGGCLSRFSSGLQGLMMSRPFLECAVRQKVRQLPNVELRENTVVEELTTDPDKKRVTGVICAGETIEADLVVDATGRGSHSPRWLEQMGYAPAEEEKVDIGLAYTTRLFRRSATDMDGDIAAIIPPEPDGKRGGVMLAQEGDRWTVTLMGHFGQVAPEELEGFIAYARTIPAPYIYDVVSTAEPIGEARSARFPASLRRRYERLERFPEGFLVFGDAISSFNPIYGQGMSTAALEAVELGAALEAGLDGVAKRFFRQAAKVVDIPWAVAVGNDLRMPETTGPRSGGVNFVNWYMGKLHKAAHHDPVPAMAFHRVGNLLAPPPSVMHPRVVLRVLIGNLRTPAVAAASRAAQA